MLLTLLSLILCFISLNPRLLIGLLITIHLVMLFGRIPLPQIGGLWLGLLPLMIIILILQPLVSPGGALIWQLGPIHITEIGLRLGIGFALRLAAGAFVAFLPVATTPIPKLVRGLVKSGMPYSLGMTVGLALNYLGTIGSLYIGISEAQQARGLDLSQRGAIKRARAAIPTLIAVIIASLRLADSLALGLAARGFGMTRSRTTYRDIHMTGLDWLALIGIIVGFAGILVASLLPL